MTRNAGRLRIIVADDNRDTADALTVLLELSGHQVTTVYDGRAAFDAALASVPDVALLDIGMPRMNGYETAQAIRKLGCRTLLVAVSGWGAKRDVERALAAGFNHHITKPAYFPDIQKLLSAAANDDSDLQQ